MMIQDIFFIVGVMIAAGFLSFGPLGIMAMIALLPFIFYIVEHWAGAGWYTVTGMVFWASIFTAWISYNNSIEKARAKAIQDVLSVFPVGSCVMFRNPEQYGIFGIVKGAQWIDGRIKLRVVTVFAEPHSTEATFTPFFDYPVSYFDIIKKCPNCGAIKNDHLCEHMIQSNIQLTSRVIKEEINIKIDNK